jgi:hypothetical protein
VAEPSPWSLVTVTPLAVSILALVVSGLTLWFSHFKVGQILMTKPTIFFFGWDGIRPKIFLRTLLFSTANNGRVLENLYLQVKSPTSECVYSFWGHTNSDANNLTRGSGLYIPKNGFLANHHFNPDPNTAITNPFPKGTYEIEVIARQFGDSANRKLGRFELQLDNEMSTLLYQRANGILWSLDPVDQSYHAELR